LVANLKHIDKAFIDISYPPYPLNEESSLIEKAQDTSHCMWMVISDRNQTEPLPVDRFSQMKNPSLDIKKEEKKKAEVKVS
jgi:hypothetical protein